MPKPRAAGEQAARNVGLDSQAKPTGGGSDANVFNEHGIACVILSTGSSDVHTTDEHVDIRDLHKACQWLARIVELAAS